MIKEKVFTQDQIDNPEKYIPYGHYCHATLENENECPFWNFDNEKPEQDNGYCHYLKRGDWDLHGKGEIFNVKTGEKIEIEDYPWGLLWDMCKECEVNMEFE